MERVPPGRLRIHWLGCAEVARPKLAGACLRRRQRDSEKLAFAARRRTETTRVRKMKKRTKIWGDILTRLSGSAWARWANSCAGGARSSVHGGSCRPIRLVIAEA